MKSERIIRVDVVDVVPLSHCPSNSGQKDVLCNLYNRRKLKIFLLVLVAFVLNCQYLAAQTCQAILKIVDPPKVCFPNRVDLTNPAITAGSSTGMQFEYYTDPFLTQRISDPRNVSEGTYYIKGVLTSPCKAFAAGAVTVVVSKLPDIKINSDYLQNAGNRIDLSQAILLSGETNGIQVVWYNDDKRQSEVKDPAFAKRNVYYLTLTNGTGCEKTEQVDLRKQ